MAIWGGFAGITMLALATAAQAHPHIFVDTTVEAIFDDQGRVTALRIGWTYDEFISLSIIESQDLDPDYDGILTPDALAALSGFDMDWDAGFAGDTFVTQAGAPVALDGPADWTASYSDGKVASIHVRRLTNPVAAPVVIQSYDPGFYTAYTIVGTPRITGRAGCTAELFTPDTTAADAALLAELAKLPTTADIEISYPAVGAIYAQDIRITCSDE